MKLQIHYFKLQWKPGVVDLHRDTRFVVDVVQLTFEIFDKISGKFLVVFHDQFHEKPVNKDSHGADVPDSRLPSPPHVMSAIRSYWSLQLIPGKINTWKMFLVYRQERDSPPIKPFISSNGINLPPVWPEGTGSIA